MKDVLQLPLYGEAIGKFAIVDNTEENRELLNYRWYWYRNRGAKKGRDYEHGYIRGRINGKLVYLHKIILPERPEGYVRDHINRDTFDNRRINLRLATHKESAQNRKVRWDKVGNIKSDPNLLRKRGLVV